MTSTGCSAAMSLVLLLDQKMRLQHPLALGQRIERQRMESEVSMPLVTDAWV